MTNITANPMKRAALGSGWPSVKVLMKSAINRYKMPMPPMTTRLAMTVQKVPFLVFHIP